MIRKIGVIFNGDGTAPYELVDDEFINEWLSKHGMQNIVYKSLVLPFGAAELQLGTGVEFCQQLAAEDVLLAAARRLGGQGCHSVLWACTSASFFKGMQYAQRLAQLLSDGAGVPASSTAIAFLAALDAIGAKRVDILSPYVPELTETMVSFFSEAGINVQNIQHMQRAPGQHIFDTDCNGELADFVASTTMSNNPIVIPCTSISSLQRVAELERIACRPIITANQVTLWHALLLAGLTPNIPASVFRR